MRSCVSLSRCVRTSAALLFGLSLVVLSGCGAEDNSYPTALTYPLRSDPILLETLTKEPLTTDRPGEQGQILSLYLDPDEFTRKVWNRPSVDAAAQAALSDLLTKTFGTPAKPTVNAISEEAVAKLGLQPDTLKQGSQLYRQHCLHCHGLTGDGRGPTAAWVSPHPRDFRRGMFKFTSTDPKITDSSGTERRVARHAHRDDLLRVLREGIESASMPSFRLLDDRELDALVSYVIHLSIRGQVEHDLLRGIKKEVFQVSDLGDTAELYLNQFASAWVANQDPKNQISPGPYTRPTAESVQRGMKQFLAKGEEAKPGAPASAAAGCTSCHVDFGRASTWRFDEWGTIVRPADLTRGMYRGGRRPIDLYWRVHAGINGVGMPAFAKDKPDAKDGLSPQDIWDIVHFLQVLPYPEKHREYGINIDTTVATSQGR